MSRQSAEEQLAFVMICLKHCPDKHKPDFEEVAKEMNLSTNTCYHRHWRLMKDWGVGNSRAAGAGSALSNNAPSTPSTPGKRGRPKGSTASKGATRVASESQENNDEDDDATPSKKQKSEKMKAEAGKHAVIEIDDDEDDDEEVED